VHEEAVQRARERLAEAADGRPRPADVDAVLERARSQVEALAAGAAELGKALPGQVADAVREGIRTEAAPVARQLAEVRGLAQQTIRRLERLDTDLTAERYSRVDDLGLLVDLIVAGWRSTEERLGRIEQALGGGEATVHELPARQDDRAASSG
jgi:hypothetical protein